MGKLDDGAVAQALVTLPDWSRDGDTIVRVVEAPSYRTAQRIVNRIADLAEGANHHPDLGWSYRRLTVALTTHDAGGLTNRDLRLAALIDDVLRDLIETDE